MSFELDTHSGVPIYVQLKQQIKYAIAAGRYPPGSQLPTVRQLAVSLRVNVNTVSRVYSELEHEGVLATRQGKGTFVKDSGMTESVAREERLGQMLKSFMVAAHDLGCAPEELINRLKEKIREEKEKGRDNHGNRD
ncbi:MAG: GntR family transcriptional regulator [Bacillota bacterium]